MVDYDSIQCYNKNMMKTKKTIKKRIKEKKTSDIITPVTSITPDIYRFVEAQELDHYKVLGELKRGKKVSCWMWYTFPQIKGLGFSDTAKYYEIQSLDELEAFVKNRYLAKNLTECLRTILKLPTNNAINVFGAIDALKLQSSMTMFLHTKKFQRYAHAVLDKYFHGRLDMKSEKILSKMWGGD